MKKSILVSAFACNPYQGTEPGYGWNFSVEMSKYFIVHCLVREKDKVDIEEAVKKNPLLYEDLNFHYVILPKLIEKLWDLNSIWWYPYYLFWQYFAFSYSKKILKSKTAQFDFVHHITWGSLQLGTFLYKLNLDLVIGPIGGGQKTPKQLLKYLGTGVYLEFTRNFMSRLMTRFNPACIKSVRKAKYILCSNEDTFKLAIKIRKHDDGVFFFPDTILPSWLIEESQKREKTFNSDFTKILWIGRFLPRKGLELAIETILKVRNAKIEVTFVGDGEYFEKIQKIVREKNLESIITFKGKVPFNEVADWYSQSDVLLFTSYRESGGVQLLEALALGLPVICLNIHGARQIVPKQASIKVELSDDNAQKLADAIELFHSSNLKEKVFMADYAKNYAQRQTWEVKVKEIVKLCYI